MKASEVYSLLASEVGSLLKEAGFKRGKGQCSWYRPHARQFIVIWCQVSRDGWDDFAGSKFVVEFQKSEEPVVGLHSAIHKRIGALMTADELEEVRKLQNQVIGPLPAVPNSYAALHVSPSVSAWYLAKFKPVSEPYLGTDDIWFRYRTPHHVYQWARFIASKLPKLVATVEAWP